MREYCTRMRDYGSENKEYTNENTISEKKALREKRPPGVVARVAATGDSLNKFTITGKVKRYCISSNMNNISLI